MIQTKVRYLSRDALYDIEKPYLADFDVGNYSGAKRSNLKIQSYEHDVIASTKSDSFNLNVNGFCILKAETSLTLEDALNRPEEVELEYQAELEQILHRSFPEYTRLEPMDFVVRIRHPNYPSQRDEYSKYEQPATIAHCDYTPEGAVQQLKGSFPGQEAHFLGKEYDIINVWKPLAGPNNDWPLAICDYTSVQSSDIVTADVLHLDRRTENQLLHSNSQHRWYYVPDQQPDEIIVFRNTDSTGKRAVGFHGAVSNPNSQGPPRSSVEVRFVAFR